MFFYCTVFVRLLNFKSQKFQSSINSNTGAWVLENISPEGSFVDSFEGRLLNPGHAIEAMWFVINIGMRLNDLVLIEKAEAIMYQQLENGWDSLY